ncbi:MAG: hypothetical protein KDD69_07685 [Bdellovibrionales bacterium]|nr:hypothetical protein [Bdellovibrionales bacterium]
MRGLFPEFRGIQPYFWELSEGFGECGATLHLIEDERIDAGGVLAQSRFPALPGMSVQLNYYLTCLSASKLLPQCLQQFAQGNLAAKAQDPDAGAYYRWPDSAAFDRLYARGYCLVSVRDVWRMLSGHFDSFEASELLSLRAGAS